MKIFELAKELKVQSKEIVALMKECGEENVTHMTSLTDEQIDFIRSEYETAKAIKEEEKAEKETKRYPGGGPADLPAAEPLRPARRRAGV